MSRGSQNKTAARPKQGQTAMAIPDAPERLSPDAVKARPTNCTGDVSRLGPMPADVTLTEATELAGPAGASVTPPRSPGADRVRRHRARKRATAAAATPLLYERADWELFVRPDTLPQKAGCRPDQLGCVVLKEALDNALDTGTEVELVPVISGYRIIDRGFGVDPSDVPRLFAVNRPLLSSKLKRLPLRGMLGNGLRVVMC